MTAPLETVLKLVAEGRLTAEEAEGIIAALESSAPPAAPRAPEPPPAPRPPGRPRFLRIEVTEAGRSAVNIRLPVSLGELAMRRLPGLAAAEFDRIRDALRTGHDGPIISTVDADGDGVRVVLE